MIKAELLTEIEAAALPVYVKDRRYGFQEKFNGERRIICKQGHSIRVYNREGEERKGIAPELIRLLQKHPLKQFVIDTEVVGTLFDQRIYILDALVLGNEEMGFDQYEYREARCHVEFNGYSKRIWVVDTVREVKGKLALIQRLMDTNAEGFVIRDMRQPYKQGRTGVHKKFKFWKTVDAVVICPSPEGKDSVRIGVYDERGRLHEICGVSLSSKFRVEPGDVVEVKYLMATRTRHILQPTILRKRTDKRGGACTISQLVVGKDYL